MTSTNPAHTHAPAWRIMTWPVGPALLVGRRRLAPRASAALANADLPNEIKSQLALILRDTRLWPSEQVDVARELIAHFQDALAAGASPARAVQDFGDPRRAARLIRRARLRARPLTWHLWMRAWQTVLLIALILLLVYAFLALRFYTAAPTIARNYAAELSSLAPAVPDNQRAWPLYREAYLALDQHPDRLLRDAVSGRELHPADPQWQELRAYLARHQHALDLIRQGATRPALGHTLAEAPDPAVLRRGLMLEPDNQAIIDELTDPDRPLIHGLLPEFHALRTHAQLLIAQSRQAAHDGDAPLASANLLALASLATHIREIPLQLADLVSFASLAGAARTTSDLLGQHPHLFTDEQLRDLAHTLSSYGGGPVRLNLLGERATLADLIQRLYTDDGRGGGRLAASGVQEFQWLLAERPPYSNPRLASMLDSSALRPMLTTLLADRAAMRDEAERIFAQLEAQLASPPWLWNQLPTSRWLSDPNWVLRYAPIAVVIADTGRAAQSAAHAALWRDAATVAIALELHRRRAGQYPASLSELVPALLPALPRDPFDGRPLRYRLRDGRPVVYSIGADRTDRGGNPPTTDELQRERRRPALANRLTSLAPETTPIEGDWILHPRHE
jgi:hypothetical protein